MVKEAVCCQVLNLFQIKIGRNHSSRYIRSKSYDIFLLVCYQCILRIFLKLSSKVIFLIWLTAIKYPFKNELAYFITIAKYGGKTGSIFWQDWFQFEHNFFDRLSSSEADLKKNRLLKKRTPTPPTMLKKLELVRLGNIKEKILTDKVQEMLPFYILPLLLYLLGIPD